MSGGVGEFLMRKMGWRTGEGLGRNREGTVEPIIIDFKVDRKGVKNSGLTALCYSFSSSVFVKKGCADITHDLQLPADFSTL